ncbi:MAG: thioesterase [Chloroflexi bacterium]|jgi:medium-chain acyl-[acyl-carrier-protein] hydrolase|nr:thioesterase [Chloroflexota bacterium]
MIVRESNTQTNARAGQAVNRWIACPKPNPQASLRLFCFPYSGASASAFYAWASSLPDAIEVCPVELPGRGARLTEPLCSRLSPLVESIAQGLLPALDKPFALFGHSMGALVSFELARHLRRRYGVEPVHLFVSGHPAPQLPDEEPPIHALPEAEFIARVRGLNGTPDEVWQHAELRDLLIPILRADFAVCETYQFRPDEPLRHPISAMAGLGDPYVSRGQMEGWRELTAGAFSLRMFPGDHFYLHADRYLLLQTVARDLSPYLGQRAV